MYSKKSENDTVHIVLVLDEVYVQHAAVTLVSLFENSKRKDNKHIHVINVGISDEGKSELVRIVNNYGSRVTFVNAGDTSQYEGLVLGRMTVAVYFKLAIPNLLKNIPRVIYLDCDIIVLKDIDILYRVNLDGAILAAAHDYGTLFGYQPFNINIGVPSKEHYFNSGVMIIDIKQWQLNNTSQKISEFLRKNSDSIVLYDQDVLNGCLWESWKVLDETYNLQQSGRFMQRDIFFTYRLYKSAHIIHFLSPFKPWSDFCPHPLRSKYYYYLAFTKWKTFKPPQLSIKRRAKVYYQFYAPKAVQGFIRKHILDPLNIPSGFLDG